MNTRKNELIERLQNVGPKFGELYTNSEIIDKSKDLQTEIANCIFEKTHAEHINSKDVRNYVRGLASEYGFEGDETFVRLDKNLSELGYTIASFIKGMKGERVAKNALKILQYDDDVRILYNVALEDDESKTEYDAIVVTPYGLFVVEVKNWNGNLVLDKHGLLHKEDGNGAQYDVPGRLNMKEFLLREYLGEAFPGCFNSILLFPNNGVKLKDEFEEITICFGGAIVNTIRSNRDNGIKLSAEQVDNIESILRASHKEQLTEYKVNTDELIADFADLIERIENKADTVHQVEIDSVCDNKKERIVAVKKTRPSWVDVVADVAGLAACVGLSFVLTGSPVKMARFL